MQNTYIQPANTAPRSSLIGDIWLLLTLRWHLAWNGFKGRKTWAKVLYIIGALWIALFAGGLSGSVGLLAGSLLHEFPDQHLDTLMPGLILTAATILILFSSFGVALGSLFLASDLDLLMSAPVDRRAVFTSKLLDGMVFYYAALLITAVPALVTYGLGMSYGPLYYLFAILALLGTPLFPAGLAAILVMLVARFAPARRVREVLGLVGALFGIGCGVLGQTSRVWMRQLSDANADPQAILSTLRGIGDIPFPSLVAGHGLSAAGTGDVLGALVGLSGFLLITFGFFAACVLLADRLYAAGWVRMQSSGSAKRTRQRAEQAASKGGMLGRASAAMAIALKDWRVIPRDLRNFAQMLSPLLILPIVYLNILGGRNTSRLPNFFGGRGFDPAGLFIAGGILFATALVFGRIAGTSISMEGKAWWLLKAAPLSSDEIIRGKFIASFLPFAVVSSVLMIGAEIWKGFSIAGFLYGWYGIELIGAAMLAVETGLAVPWARLDWDDPRRMSSGWGSILTLVAWALMGLAVGGALCLPLVALAADPPLEIAAAVAGLVIATVVAAGSGWLALRFGADRLSAVGET